MKRLFSILSLILFGTFALQAQNKFTVSGTVTDKSTGEAMIGVLLRAIQSNGTAAGGAYSNEYGFYSITLPEGDYTLNVDYLGYDTLALPLRSACSAASSTSCVEA